MIATAHVTFNRCYFELQYDEWLHYRSRYKRYEIWFALALTLFGVTMAIAFWDQWLVGALFASAGVYEFVMAAHSADEDRYLTIGFASSNTDLRLRSGQRRRRSMPRDRRKRL